MRIGQFWRLKLNVIFKLCDFIARKIRHGIYERSKTKNKSASRTPGCVQRTIEAEICW